MLTTTLPVGVAVSLLLFELTGLSAGGIISPAYVALVLDDPPALGLLAATTLLTWAFVQVLARTLFLYGSRRFSVTVLVGMTLGAGAHMLQPAIGDAIGLGLGPTATDWAIFGIVVPGLIAHQFARQGIVPTLLLIAIAAPIVRVIALVFLHA